MPTFPLYAADSAPDAWHRVTAPGGYEWWYFDAEDIERDRQIVAILFQGFVFHPGYLRAYARYRRRPTRVAPPLPESYPCAYFVVYEQGRIAQQFMARYAPGAFTATAEEVRVAVGPNLLEPSAEGDLKLSVRGTPWALTAQGPQLLAGRTLAGQFRFSPRTSCPPLQRTFLSRRLSGAEHHWILANPLCDVTGSISLNGETIDFRGRGYHDHNFGTAPLGPGLKRWIWGRVLLDDSAITFHFARARDPDLPDEVHLVRADSMGMREIPIAVVSADWSRRTALRLAYPNRLELENALALADPRVIDSSPFYLRLTYDARHGEQRGRAFCEIAYPHRLRWPVLGRMIGMSIHQAD